MINCSAGFHVDFDPEFEESKNSVKQTNKAHNQILRKPVTPFNYCTSLHIYSAIAPRVEYTPRDLQVEIFETPTQRGATGNFRIWLLYFDFPKN